ncbi:MAG: aldo/keto reductase [Candidatus Nanopelagicales bacterium]|nr:aldo/keto reductase [Candidatus Nanopelagicales bacterium]MDZ4248952.1 aldo/keto reductase [Candidatus Nanopelagicales bacterium]
MNGACERLVLGTAQFGLDYGISNAQGRVSEADAAIVLNRGVELGVRWVDTAAEYGGAESALRAPLSRHCELQVISKLAPLSSLRPLGGDVIAAVHAGIRQSVARLGRQPIDVLLVHRAADLWSSDADAIAEALDGARELGLVRRIGFSAYDREEIDRAVQAFRPEVVQVPASVYDQTLTQGPIQELAAEGVEVHARSVYLQGLILLEPDRLSGMFRPLAAHQDRFHSNCRAAGMTPQQACVAFALQVPGIARIVVGTTTASEVEQACGAAEGGAGSVDWMSFGINDTRIRDPRRWPDRARL